MDIRAVLRGKRVFVLDMDGTFYLGDRILDGSLDFIQTLGAAGRKTLFFTNNSSKTSEVYVQKLTKMGCPVKEDQVITSGMVTAQYVKSRWPSPKVFLLGTPLLEADFRKAGIHLTDQGPDAVVAGFDTTVTYEKLSTACRLVRTGVPFLATHPDFNCPTEDGFIPDCGAICAFITASTGAAPKYLGKPCLETLAYLLTAMDCSKEDLVFVGDRLYTDIAIAARHGVTGILVLSGETQPQDIPASPDQPDFVVQGLAELARYL